MISFDRHSSGGLDVTESINLFFKGVLLFPIFLFAIYTGATMMKHMIFHGLPLMNKPTEQQTETIRLRDHSVDPNVNTTITPEQVAERTNLTNQILEDNFKIREDGTRQWVVPSYDYNDKPTFIEGDRGYTKAEQEFMYYCTRELRKPLPDAVTPEFFDGLNRVTSCGCLFRAGRNV